MSKAAKGLDLICSETNRFINTDRRSIVRVRLTRVVITHGDREEKRRSMSIEIASAALIHSAILTVIVE